MKNSLYNRSVFVVMMIIVIIATVGCGNKKTGQFNEQTQNNKESLITDAPIPTEEIVDDSKGTTSSSPTDDMKNDTTDNTVSAEGPGSDDGIVTDGEDITYTDHMNTIEYIVKMDGKYEFECESVGGKGYWDIYVLDERFEDALRYLTSAHEPTFKATDESKEISLKKGQYVYGVCSINSFTDNGETAKGFKCPLTIEYDN